MEFLLSSPADSDDRAPCFFFLRGTQQKPGACHCPIRPWEGRKRSCSSNTQGKGCQAPLWPT
jgi:hypothetical protein